MGDNFSSKKSNSGIVAIVILLSIILIAIAVVSVILAVKSQKGGESENPTEYRDDSTSASGQESKKESEKETEPDGLVVSKELEKKLEAVRDRIDAYYLFDQEDVDYDSAILKGYVSALGDPYTVYYTPEEYAEMMEDSSGVYCGIGVSIQQNPDTGIITIIQVFHDSPAEEAGLRPGDEFYKVGGREVLNEDINIVVTWVRGEPGSTVEIEVYRPSVNDYYKTTCTRRQVETETVSWKMMDGQIGYIEVNSFEEVTFAQFKTGFEELHDAGMKGLIVDLRSNGGGLLDSVTDMLDFLLPEGVLTYCVEKTGYSDYYTSDASAALDVPMVVLADGYSASASEVFIGAVLDYGVATLVGTQTFGKGIVQVILPFEDGSGLKVTIARYYSPNGVCIHGEGFTPDVVVPYDPDSYDPDTDTDNQVEKAVEVLKSKMK